MYWLNHRNSAARLRRAQSAQPQPGVEAAQLVVEERGFVERDGGGELELSNQLHGPPVASTFRGLLSPVLARHVGDPAFIPLFLCLF